MGDHESELEEQFEKEGIEGTTPGDDAERKSVYTSLSPKDYKWLSERENEMGASKSEVLRRLVYNARVREAFDETEFI